MIWSDGATYEGEWQYNQAYGEGTFYHTSGDVYSGQWSNNNLNGEGKYQNAKGASHLG